MRPVCNRILLCRERRQLWCWVRGLPVGTCELDGNDWSVRNTGFQGLIEILHGMEGLNKSSATNHGPGFLFEHLADGQVLVRALGKSPLGEGLFVEIVI